MREYFRLFRLLKPYKKLLLVSFILSILYSAANAISVYLSIPLLRTLFQSDAELQNRTSDNFINSIRYKFESLIFSGGDKVTILARVCILMLLFYFAKNLFGYLQGLLTEYVEKSMITDVRRKLYEKYNTLSLKYFSGRRAGDIISRIISDVNALQHGVSVTFTNLVKDPLIIIIFVFMAFAISWKLTLLSSLIIPMSLVLIIFTGKKLNKYSRKVQEKLADFTSTISETVYGSKIIRAFSMERFENRKFNKQLKEYFRIIMKHSVYNDLTRPLTEFISVAVGVFIIWYGGNQVFASNNLAPEEFIGFLIITFQLMSPIKDLATVNNRIQESSAAAQRIFEVLDRKPAIRESDEPLVKNSFEKNIEFKNVSFRYNEDKLILNDINLDIKKNEKIALVGLSGEGKSTLVDLLPRFYDVTSGEVLIDGINIKDINIESLRNLFGIVTQEIILFNDSIRNNIASGLNNVSDEKIIEAAYSANAHKFIMRTENGYDTIIGERGIKLSGGQKQRIAIARALLKNAPILIFDEATSSLDTESEKLIQEAIERLIQNKTSIVIAHRLSTIKNANRIIVLHNGKINTVGTHKELILDNHSIYKKLYEMQFS